MLVEMLALVLAQNLHTCGAIEDIENDRKFWKTTVLAYPKNHTTLTEKTTSEKNAIPKQNTTS